MKKKDSENCLMVYPEDIDPEQTQERGGTAALDIWTYCEFFAKHIQERLDDVWDGLSIYEYAEKMERDNQLGLIKKLIEFTHDGRLFEFQRTMEQYGVHINGFALCNLCMFVIEISRHHYAMLLRPTISDTLSEITELEHIEFVNADGTRTSSNNSKLLQYVRELLAEKAKEKQVYETECLTRMPEVMTRELTQMDFFCNMERFLQLRFPFKRGKRGTASLLTEEYQMIGYWMKWFGLSPVEVTPERLRQLRMKSKKNQPEFNIANLPLGEKTIKMQLNFIKYTNWRHGKINLMKEQLETLQPGDTVHFAPGTKQVGDDK